VTSCFGNLLASTAKSLENAIQATFNGPQITDEEVECSVLLKSRLLQVTIILYFYIRAAFLKFKVIF